MFYIFEKFTLLMFQKNKNFSKMFDMHFTSCFHEENGRRDRNMREKNAIKTFFSPFFFDFFSFIFHLDAIFKNDQDSHFFINLQGAKTSVKHDVYLKNFKF